MRVFSYVVVSDSGFAPNPFHGVCTLACCKPVIRRHAAVDDIVIGLSSRCERIVYAMQILRIMSFDEYWADKVATAKRPDRSSTNARERRGDNIYQPLGRGQFHQLPSVHSAKDGSLHAGHYRQDLGGLHVLVADEFCYFGDDGPPLSSDLGFLKIGRGHRCDFASDQIQTVKKWFEGLPRGVLGPPAKWPSDDSSWISA